MKLVNVKTVLVLSLVVLCSSLVVAQGDVPLSPLEIRPLNIGQKISSIVLRDKRNDSFDIKTEVWEKPAVVIFYRGGWDPFCVSHLKKLQKIEKELQQIGCQLIAISPDRQEMLKRFSRKHRIRFPLLSDSEMEAAQLFGVAYQVDDETAQEYRKEYNVDLEAASGLDHHMLPVPSVFLLDAQGIVRFSYSNANYKERIRNELLLEAARAAAPHFPVDFF